ncbi:MAG: tRNA/rRNA methyltransferase [Bacteroidota bacterium]|nr:tRNA/rRNA methyltransferase [Bacteroidota bacterium]
MKTVFILVEPAVPENIGASARAIKTMGFNELRLVNPGNHLANEAKWLAHASGEILEDAKVFSTLEEATKDIDFLVASSAKKRNIKHDYYPIEEVSQIIENKKEIINTIGIVFGREESGLTNSEINLCDIVSFIPLHTTYPSLNLSQAVMLYAYIFSTNPITNINYSAFKEGKEEYRGFRNLKNDISISLKKIGIKIENPIYNRILERISVLSKNDLHLIHSVSNKIVNKLNK